MSHKRTIKIYKKKRMEFSTGRSNKAIVFFYEALGTAWLLFAINLQYGMKFGQFSIAFMIFAWCMFGGQITGGHYNPAVSIGVYISNKHWKEDWYMMVLMIVAQCFGAFLGLGLAWIALYNINSTEQLTRAGVPVLEVNLLLPNSPTVTIANTFMIEMVCTFMFVIVNLIVKTGKTQPTKDGMLSCFAVGWTLLAMICVSGSKTGACLNPAVGIAQTVWGMIQYGSTIPDLPGNTFEHNNFAYYLWVYTLAPTTGALLAGLAHRGHLKAYAAIAETNAGHESKLID